MGERVRQKEKWKTEQQQQQTESKNRELFLSDVLRSIEFAHDMCVMHSGGSDKEQQQELVLVAAVMHVPNLQCQK